ALEAGFRRRGAAGPAFPSIVAGGTNATVLHYVANNSPLADGALLLIDAGARLDHYCADISRTVPVSGRFTPDQRRLYGIVQAAHAAASAAVRPGGTVAGVHAAAAAVLRAGLSGVGLIPDAEPPADG